MNISSFLSDRKLIPIRRCTLFPTLKRLYSTVIYPNKTAYNVQVDHNIRKFTPDGKVMRCTFDMVVSDCNCSNHVYFVLLSRTDA